MMRLIQDEMIFIDIVEYFSNDTGKCPLKAYADSEGPDQTAHKCSLISAYAVHLKAPYTSKIDIFYQRKV